LRATSEQDLSMAELLERYREAGISRVMGLIPGCVESDEPLTDFADAAVRAGSPLTR